MQNEQEATTQTAVRRMRDQLARGVDGVLAPQSGGCARHVLSQRVACTMDEDGAPAFVLDGSNASSLRLLVDSTVTLMIECADRAGEEYHLTGRLSPTEDGRYRMQVIRAYHVCASGEKQPIPATNG